MCVRHRGLLGGWKSLFAFGCFAALFGHPKPAAAQYFTLDRAITSGTPDDGFMVFRPYVSKEDRFYMNGALGFSLNPLRSESVTAEPSVRRGMETPIRGQFPLYLQGGVQFLGRYSLNVALPFYPLQIPGRDPNSSGVGRGGIGDAYAGVGDLRLDARMKIWESEKQRGRIGAAALVTIPWGTESTFGGDTGASALLLANAEHDFGPFLLSGHAGVHFKAPMGIGGTNGNLLIGHELRYAIGAYLPMKGDRLRLGLEIWGSTSIENRSNQSPFFGERNTTVEWLAQGRYLLDRKKRFFLNFGGGTRLSAGYGSSDIRLLGSIGTYFLFSDFEEKAPAAPVKVIESKPEYYDPDTDGDGYPDTIDQCPNEKEDGKAPRPSDGCPAPSDRDGDGIFDVDDKCPDAAEDFDGYGDEDGCPEVDFDGDSVPDDEDDCPDEPGKPSAKEGQNGCPTLTKLSDDGTVQILTPIEFDRGKTTIKATSLPILDEVIALLKVRTEFRVGIYGHTDNLGSRENNIRLSQERAEEVRRYMIDKGIEEDRLESDGFGPDKPIDSNDTFNGRARNRRVEFVILNQQANLKEQFTE